MFVVVLRKEPFADQNQVVLVRTVLSLAVGVIGAVVPGFLQIDLGGKGVAIRAGGALALFVITFFFSPNVLPLAVSKEQLDKIEKASAETRSDVGRIVSKFDSISVQAIYELPKDEPDVKVLATCLTEIGQAVRHDRKAQPRGLTISYSYPGSDAGPSKPPVVSIDLEQLLNEGFVNLSPKLVELVPFVTFLRQPKLQIGINRSQRASDGLVNSFLGLADRPDLYLFAYGSPVDPQKGNFGKVILDASRQRVLVSWNGLEYPLDKWATSRQILSIQDLDKSQFVVMLSNPGTVDPKLDQIAAKCRPIWLNIRFDNSFVTFENFNRAPPVLKWQAFSTSFPSAQTILDGKASRPFVVFVSSRVLLERRRSRGGSSTRGGSRGLVAQRAVRALVVVFLLKPSGEPPCLGQVGKLLAVQKLVSQAAEGA